METTRDLITRTFETFDREMMRLCDRRACDCELPGWPFYTADARHHMSAVLFDLETLERERADFERMTDVQRVLVREAYLSILAMAQVLRDEDSLVEPHRIELGRRSIARMLDALVPYVSEAELGLRRIVEGIEVGPAAASRN